MPEASYNQASLILVFADNHIPDNHRLETSRHAFISDNYCSITG